MTRHDRKDGTQHEQLSNYRTMRQALDSLLGQYEDELESAARTADELADFEVRTASEDKQVVVGVDATGTLTNLELGWETFGRYTPVQLAEAVLELTRRAREQAADQIEKLPTGTKPLETDRIQGDAKRAAVPTEH